MKVARAEAKTTWTRAEKARVKLLQRLQERQQVSFTGVLRGDDVIVLQRVVPALGAPLGWRITRPGRFFSDAVAASARYFVAALRRGFSPRDVELRLHHLWHLERGAPELLAKMVVRAAVARATALKTKTETAS